MSIQVLFRCKAWTSYSIVVFHSLTDKAVVKERVIKSVVAVATIAYLGLGLTIPVRLLVIMPALATSDECLFESSSSWSGMSTENSSARVMWTAGEGER